MERQILERWLPGISLIVGLLFLAAAAFGQGTPSVTSSDPGSDASGNHRMGDWRISPTTPE